MNSYETLKLYGHTDSFSELKNLYDGSCFPSKILFTGKKGIGKSTTAYHLINYIFSIKESHPYDFKNFKIDNLNKSFKLIQNNSHPNFFHIGLKGEKKNIDINQVREMYNFVNKSSFYNKNKIVLIDDAEFLNKSSSNALLKIIEEPNANLYFILILDNEKYISETLKSRCIEYKFKNNFETTELIVNNFFNESKMSSISTNIKHDSLTAGFYIEIIEFLDTHKFNSNEITVKDLILFMMQKKLYKDSFLRKNLFLIIQLYFIKNKEINSKEFFFKYKHFIDKLNNVLKFNLDIESFFIEFKSKILDEK
tara:strand:+ start:235 stop:1161 length:927 start_codon:yes stop_codon:yes gene_type:complete